MGTVSDLLSLAGAKSKSDAFPTPTANQPSVQPSLEPNAAPPANREKATLADVGARIGEDNEVLRNLLIDTSNHLNAFDDLKESFGKLVDPLNNVLTTLEQERAENASSRGALAAMRSSHETLRTDFQQLEKQSSELAGDNERMRRELESALANARELDLDRAKLSSEIAGGRAAMAMIVKQLGEETSNVRVLSEDKRLLVERANASDKRAVALESEVAHARERLSLLENAKNTSQAALDRTLADVSRMSRRLAETETALSDTRGKIQHMESSVALAEAERNKAAAACDEANERRQTEVYALGLKLDALRSHSDAAEQLLANARQSLVARTEEIRVAEAKLLEAILARGELEKTAEEHAAIIEGWEQQTKALEQANADLMERCRILSETLVASESWLVHAKDKIKSLTGHVEQLQSDAAATRAKNEEDFVQLNATIEHERSQRALAEGALETIRSDYARVQAQMAQERSMRRSDHQRRVIGNANS
jgi:crescentin